MNQLSQLLSKGKLWIRFWLCYAFLSIFFFSITYSQGSHSIDSLKHVLTKLPEDSNKVLTLLGLTTKFIDQVKLDEAKIYVEDALLLAEKIDFKNGIAQANLKIGLIHQVQGNFLEAMDNYLQSMKYYQESGNKWGILHAHLSIGYIETTKGNNTQALLHYNTALALAKEIGNKDGAARAYNRLGLVYGALGDQNAALQYFKQSYEYWKILNDTTNQAELNNNIGLVHWQQGNLSAAKETFLLAIELGIQVDARKALSSAYNNIGGIYYEEGDLSNGLKYILLSLKEDEKIGDKNGIAISNNNIGIIYTEMGNYEEALKYHLRSLKMHEEIGYTLGISEVSGAIGNIYGNLNKYEEALKYYLISLEIAGEMENKRLIAADYLGIGSIYQQKRDFNEALNYSLKSLSISKEMEDTSNIIDAYFQLADLHMEMQQFNEATKYLTDAISLSSEIGRNRVIQESYYKLAHIDSLMGNWQESLNHYKLYTQQKDNLLNETNSKMITEIQTKYETENKDKEIQRLESEKQISSLQFQVQQESLTRIESDRDRLHIENLFNLQQVKLLDKEKSLQNLELEKNQADMTAQRAETESKGKQVILLNQQGEIKDLQLKRKTQLQYYTLIGFFLFGLLSIFIYSNFRTRQKLKMQMLRNKIASDLHDDVGSTLSSIAIFSQMAQQQSKEVIPLLNTIHDSSRKMLEAMADIVWAINPENDQFEKIVLRMMNFAFDLLGSKDIDYKFIADENIRQMKLPMEVRKNLYLIFKEATNNMVKYSEASKAHISLQEEKDVLTMEIRDNGKGFDPNRASNGNGLKNMKKRAIDMGANLKIESKHNEGTLIAISVAI